ncbi:GNAT family N-acetyltransferase [Fulvimarina endophytica]|uniref:GNAT family N-acetyltransferase n=1 Tax=Fulvimarina endophytica TaxID=2293836 RepID=A0A371WZG3_9HYPH|nr:GNAT family N-acetyltransferase [Fulvimarina endophytica]RFC62378.1 GNAT family N-acetyltransferase [Fulvimarina endophytica]
MAEFTLRANAPFDLEPLARLLHAPDDLARVNPNAKHPFDPLEWQEKWLNEPSDRSYFLIDESGREVGFFALREGIGPEVRHLVYVFVEEAARGGTGKLLASLAEERARELGAISITLKVELDNKPALSVYEEAGFEELGRSNGMATMRKDWGPSLGV